MPPLKLIIDASGTDVLSLADVIASQDNAARVDVEGAGGVSAGSGTGGVLVAEFNMAGIDGSDPMPSPTFTVPVPPQAI